MNAQDNFYTNLRACIEATFPDVTAGKVERIKASSVEPGGVWDALHIDTVPFEKTKTPFIAFEVDDATDVSGQWGSVLQTWQYPISIYYVEDYKGGRSKIGAKLEKMKRALLQYDSTKMTILDAAQKSVGTNLPLNALNSTAGRQVRAGMLVCTAIVSEHYHTTDDDSDDDSDD